MTPAPEHLPLRDIHLPAPVAWWPPAPGWWGLLLCCLLLVFSVWAFIRIRRRGRLKTQSLLALRQLAEQFERDGDAQRLTTHLSTLLRRVALSLYPRRQVAALTGIEWLRFLDSSLTPGGNEKAFSEGVGRVLTEAPYNPNCRVDGVALINLIRRWITGNAGGWRG